MKQMMKLKLNAHTQSKVLETCNDMKDDTTKTNCTHSTANTHLFDIHKYEQARNMSHQLCSSESIGPEC